MWEAYKIYYRDDDSYVKAYLGDELIWQKLVNNVIYYTSTDNQVVTPYAQYWGTGVNLISNTYSGGQGVMIFDNDVQQIGYQVFRRCSTLSSIIIPESVTKIDSYAFERCTSLTSIYIPAFVGEMLLTTGNPFAYCSGLTSITVDSDNTKLDSRNNCNAVIRTRTNELIIGCKNTVIPNTVTTIGYGAFQGQSELTSINIPSSVTAIGYQAFGSSGLVSINIPDSVTEIGNQAFRQTSLTSVFIPDSVTTIETGAFVGCGSLSVVIFESSTVPTVGTNVFNANAEGRKIYVPAISLQDYKSNANLNRYEADIYPYGGMLFYKSTDNQIVTPYDNTSFGANLIDNIYNGNQGIMLFDGPVTQIENSAFYGCTNLEEIEIPDTVTTIGAYAFYGCTGLTSINIPASVTSITNNPFMGCTSLTSITVDPNNTTYDNRNNCNAIISTSTNILVVGCENTVIPNTVTQLGTRSFSNQTGLTSITIPSSVTTINNRAFYECTSLSEVIMESTTPPTLGTNVFSHNASERKIYVPASSLNAYKTATNWSDYASDIVPYGITDFIYYTSTDNNIVTPYTNDWGTGVNLITNTYSGGQGVMGFDNPPVKIGANTFSGKSTLKTITIPNTVTSIGNDAFKNCTGLKSINIPASVTSLGTYVFSGCYNVTSITVDSNNTMYDSRNNCNAIIRTSTNRLRVGCKNTVIPNTVTSIGGYTFLGQVGLTSITIPSSITEIALQAFKNTGLTSVTIPSSVTTIGNQAFNGASSLSEVTMGGTTPPTLGTSVFDGNASGRKIYVPIASLNTYKTATNWSSYEPYIYPYGSVSYVYYTSTNGNVVTPYTNDWGTGVNLISNTYSGGQGTMLFDGIVTKIGTNVFNGKSTLKTITIPNTVTSLENDAFRNCTGLVSINIPASVTSMGSYVFRGCYNVTSITVDSNNTAYDSRNNCNAIIKTSTNGLVAGCKNTVIPNTVTSIGANAFSGQTGLTSITIPSSVTTIGSSSFKNTGLTSVTIPSSVTTIGNQAFNGVSGLETVNVKASTPPTLGTSVFDGNAVGRVIIVPAARLNTYKSATNWSSYNPYIIADTPGVIRYTSYTGKVTPYSNNFGGANIVSNTYSGGQGVITFDRPLTKIGDAAFFNRSFLTSVTLPNTLTIIGQAAFRSCPRMIQIDIPPLVSSIGKLAFNNCSSMYNVTVRPTTPPVLPANEGYDVFSGEAENRYFYVPSGSLLAYKSAAGWSIYSGVINPL